MCSPTRILQGVVGVASVTMLSQDPTIYQIFYYGSRSLLAYTEALSDVCDVYTTVCTRDGDDLSLSIAHKRSPIARPSLAHRL